MYYFKFKNLQMQNSFFSLEIINLEIVNDRITKFTVGQSNSPGRALTKEIVIYLVIRIA